MMDCAAFENRLTEVLAGELDPATSRGVLTELEDHAANCAECGAATEWVELAALPAAERDPVEPPSAAYWDGFNASVARRVESRAERAPATGWRPLAAAAAITLALAAGWYLRGRVAPEGADIAELAAQDDRSGDWSLLEELILEATPEELASALSLLPGNGWDGYEAGIRGEWLPDADELDESDQEQLMEWLDQLDQSEGRPIS